MTPVTLLFSLAEAAGSPKISGPPAPVAEGEAVTLTFTAPGAGPSAAFLDGCTPVELERHEGESWVPVPRAPCSAPVAATRVDGSLTLTLAAPGAGEYRGVVTWGSQCLPDLPFAFASCKKLAFLRTDPFTVTPGHH